jgi:hypothetical protein
MAFPSLSARDGQLSRPQCRLIALGAAVVFSLCSGLNVPASAATATAITVTVTGNSETRLAAKTQFKATVTGAANSTVVWQVNGTTGGSAADGTISSAGLYTAPKSLPTPNAVTIEAISGGAHGTLKETILNPLPVVTSAKASQKGASLTYSVGVAGSDFVDGAEVRISGNPVSTTFVSATQLTATTTVASGTKSLAIDVVNPNSGNTPSATLLGRQWRIYSMCSRLGWTLISASSSRPLPRCLRTFQRIRRRSAPRAT